MKRIALLAIALLIAGTACAQAVYREQRRTLFELLPVRSSDIVFLGNSITDGGECDELFDNRHIKTRGICSDRPTDVLRRLDPNVDGHPNRLLLIPAITDLTRRAPAEEVDTTLRRLLRRLQS